MNWMYEILTGPRGEKLEGFASRIGKEVERLIGTEERFNLAVRLSRIAVFRVARDLTYEWAFNEWAFNPPFGAEGESEGIVGKSNRDLFVDEDADLIDQLFAEALTGGLPQTFDVRLRGLQSGRDRHLEILVEPLRGEDGQIEALTGAALDISPEVERQREVRMARGEAEAARQQADKARGVAVAARERAEEAKSEAEIASHLAEEARTTAEQANRTKTRFMAAAGHDLRQPLQAMRLFQNVVASRFRVARDQHGLDAAEAIGRAISSAEELLNSLMDLATLEAGAVEVHMADVPASEVINGIISDFRGMAERKGLKLLIHPCSLAIRSDPILLKRIIRNLTVNAIKYAQQGGVLVGCRPRQGGLRIEVWDTGPGIPDDQLELIFDEFYRGSEAADAGGGLGIGLTIVARLAHLLGCEVTVRSRVGKGSLFAVTVPLARPEPSDVPLGWNSSVAR